MTGNPTQVAANKIVNNTVRRARVAARYGWWLSLEAPVRSEVRAVGGGALVFGMVFLDRLAPLYLIVVIREQEGLAAHQLALVPLTIGLGWAVAMGVGRWLSGRLSDRSRIALGAGGAGLVHVASALVGGWPAFLLLRFLGGVLAGTVAPPLTGLIFAWAPRRRRGLDAGILFSATRLLGSLVAPVVVLSVAVRADWRSALLTAAVLLLAATAAFWLITPPAPAASEAIETTAAQRREQARPVLARHGRRNITLATVFGILFACWLNVVSQTGPSVVVASLDVTPDTAGAIVGAFGIGGWLAALFVPMASDRVGRGLAVGTSTAVGGAAGLGLSLVLAVGSAPPWAPAVLFAFGGLTLGALPLALSVIPGEAVLRGDPGRAVIWPVFGAEVVGAAVLPAVALLGFLPERATLTIAAGALLASAALAKALVPPDRDEQSAEVPVPPA